MRGLCFLIQSKRSLIRPYCSLPGSFSCWRKLIISICPRPLLMVNLNVRRLCEWVRKVAQRNRDHPAWLLLLQQNQCVQVGLDEGFTKSCPRTLWHAKPLKGDKDKRDGEEKTITSERGRWHQSTEGRGTQTSFSESGPVHLTARRQVCVCVSWPFLSAG